MAEKGNPRIIMRLKKLVRFWRFYGTKGVLYKCWEKAFLDPHRYSGGHGAAPDLYSSKKKPTQIPEIKAEKPLEIWYLVHCFFPEKKGGTERFVLNVAQTQQRLGHRVRVITLGMEPLKEYDHHSQDIFWKEYSFQGISVISFRYKRTPFGLYYKRIDENDKAMAAFARLLFAQHRPDIVHCAYGQPMAAFLKICRIEKIPYLMTLTGFDSLCHYTTMVDKSGRFCQGSEHGLRCQKNCRTYGIKDYQERWKQAKRYLFGAAYVAVPSEYVAKVVEKEFEGLSTLVIPHGIHPPVTNRVRRGYVRHFSYIGTLTEMKGIPLLLDAFSYLPDDCTLEIYGDGNAEYTARLQQLSGHDARIHFRGSLPPERIGEAYERSDCVVVPSLVPETYNFVLREALQSGCFVIAARIGAMPEAVKEGENGFLFTPGDSQDLLRALNATLKFKMESYRQTKFPSIAEEGRQYEALYVSSALQYTQNEETDR